MVFNSLIFIAFFTVVYGLYQVLPHRWQNVMLLGASYFFYGWWDWQFLGLILVSTVVDFAVGIALDGAESASRRKWLLLVSVATNLGILAVFKYANFFVESLEDAVALAGLSWNLNLARIVLPVGISFYTFQTMSYTIDIYRGELRATRNFLDFALFVSFFPQLVAGPIERARVLIPQLTHPRRVRQEQFEEGCWLILTGYYLKCVLADNLAPFTEQIFGTPSGAHGLEIVAGIYAAAFQIYGDFAGYSRIARGISKLMGIDLMQNFHRPYLAVDPSDFWRRWHISLSTWLRDYLYIPLGGNRGSTLRTYRNLMLTMLLGGLWHGAAWNFVAWGLFHGLLLCVWRVAGRAGNRNPTSVSNQRPVQLLRVIAFFQITCIGWLLFFVKDLSDVRLLFHQCVSQWAWNGVTPLVTIVVFAGPVLLIEYLGERSRQLHPILQWRPAARLATYALITMAICLSGAVSNHEFIYFQF